MPRDGNSHTLETVMKRIIPIAVACALILSGCAVTERLSMQKSGNGTSDINVSVEPFFIDVLNDFEEFADSKNPQSVMDKAVSDMEKNLSNGQGTGNVSFKKTGERTYEGVFTFTSIANLLADLGSDKDQSLLTVSGNTLRFHVDIGNYPQLCKVIPFLADKNFEPFGPTYNQGISEADYLDMISFMLGEEGPDAIRNSRIILNLKTPGTITSFTGGKKIDDTTFQFSFPLIDFLLLQNNIDCSVTWAG